MNKKILVGCFACASLICTFAIYIAIKPSAFSEKYIIINDPDSDEKVAATLVEHKITNNFYYATFAIKFYRLLQKHIKFGEYEIPKHASVYKVLRILNIGKVAMHKFCIPDGFSIFQISKRFNKNEHLLGEMEKNIAEGSLMPDTYIFTYPTTKKEIIKKAQTAMREFIEQEWPKRSKDCVIDNPNDALILASIIEKESYKEKEKYLISGIYHHRLKIKMKLQACPTVIYAHKRGDAMGRSLTISDVLLKDPYNTYMNQGLPPTPIANPGKKSILAALHPIPTDCLFFVCNTSGNHIFSKTYEEHLKYIADIKQKAAEIKKRKESLKAEKKQ